MNFNLKTTTTTSNEQPQLGILEATSHVSAPFFSLCTGISTFETTSITTTTKTVVNLGTTNTPPFSFGASQDFGFVTYPSTNILQSSNAAIDIKTSAPYGFTLSAMPTFPASNGDQALNTFSFKSTTQASTEDQALNEFSFKNTTPASRDDQALNAFSFRSTAQDSREDQALNAFSFKSTTQASNGTLFENITQASSDFPLGVTTQKSMGISLNTTSTAGFSLGTFGTTTITQAATTQMATAVTTQALTTFQSDSLVSTTQLTDILKLIDLINNWTVSLENQKNQFLNQANEITVWNNMLKNQSRKVLKLYDMLERKKKEQIDIESEIQFLLSHQKELEDCLIPLEQELQSAEVSSCLNNEREPIFKAAQEMEYQLKEMSNDIRDIVNGLNKTNSKKDPDDDLDTISHILNCYMTALQFLEHNTEIVSSKVAEVNEENSNFFKRF